MRARGFAARDAFPDKLSGLILAEEALDYPAVIDVTPGQSALPPAQSLLEALPEGVRGSIEKAFEELALAPGVRLVKLNEFLSGEGVDQEVGANELLNWCRDEYAKRKTGQPRAKGEGNGKTRPNAPATTQVGSVDRGTEPGHVVGTQPADAPASGSPAPASAPVSAPAKATSAPLTAEDIGF